VLDQWFGTSNSLISYEKALDNAAASWLATMSGGADANVKDETMSQSVAAKQEAEPQILERLAPSFPD
jgi:hypothetical protein